jgi:hypothetical protein
VIVPQRGPQPEPEPLADEKLGSLVRRAVADLQVMTRDEIALARLEISKGLKKAAGEAAAVVLGGIVALVGFALLCASAVAALAPIIPALWARMLIMAAAYLVLGAVVAAGFAARLRRDLPPTPTAARQEARETIDRVRKELRHA